MKAKFKYEDKEITIQFNIEESAQEVFNHFVNKTFLNIDDLLFKYDNNLLSFNTTLFSQLNLPLENNEIEILVLKKDRENEHYVNISVDGVNKKIAIQKGKGVFESVSQFLKKRTRTLLLFYNGKVIDGTDKKKTFNELANKASKETNVMNVVATDKVEQQ